MPKSCRTCGKVWICNLRDDPEFDAIRGDQGCRCPYWEAAKPLVDELARTARWLLEWAESNMPLLELCCPEVQEAPDLVQRDYEHFTEARVLLARHEKEKDDAESCSWCTVCGICGRENHEDEDPWPNPEVCPNCEAEERYQEEMRNAGE